MRYRKSGADDMARKWTVAEKEEARRRQSEYWSQMAKVADQIGVNKQAVHQNRFALERAEAIEKLGERTWTVRDAEKARAIIEGRDDGGVQQGYEYDDDPGDPKHERIKMALWLIRKCGGIQEAEDALRRAKRALKGD